MKYALIGCGRIAENHIKAAVANGLLISAVCDVLPKNMERVLKLAGEKNISALRYTDYRKMLSDIKPDIAAIATESGKHAEIAIACIENSANVIIEKPIALSLTDADKIILKAEEKGVKACVCHPNRFNPSAKHLRDAIEKGRFGKISHGSVHVRWNRNDKYYKEVNWRGTASQDGGVLLSQAIHAIDIFLWLMGGCADEVFAYTANRLHDYIECEDIGVAIVKFKNGALGTIEATTNVYPKNLEETIYIFGEKGTAKLGGKSVDTIEIWNMSQDLPCDKAFFKQNESGINKAERPNIHNPIYADMLSALESGSKPFIGLDEGRRSIELILAIYESARTGRAVKI